MGTYKNSTALTLTLRLKLNMETNVVVASDVPLHSMWPLRRRNINRIFAVVYSIAILSLLYHHVTTLKSTKSVIFFVHLLLLISDVLLAYMWSTVQAFRMNPVNRQVFPENLEKYLAYIDFPALDIFICTADPYKEPPINVVNTALSVMAYDYPTEKLSVYVSDDGGSELTMFAFMEAAKFGKVWLPFCRENNVVDRCPDAYFSSNNKLGPEAVEIKVLYEKMRNKVQNAVENGKVNVEYISNDERDVLNQYWRKDFTPRNHPSLIQVLLNAGKDVDATNQAMPSLIYVSREKNKAIQHNFKAGALNTLIRVSGIMTNAPIVLTLDCDMYSNDPLTPQRALCYLSDKSSRPNLGYVQFPQLYHGLNKGDIYGCAFKRSFEINPIGMDGLAGPAFLGTGGFFFRRVFFGGPSPSSYVQPEIPTLSPGHITNKDIDDQEILNSAHRVATCNYENQSNWGFKMGFRYGSLVEDFNTAYRLHCEGWESIFCDPIRPAFLGDMPLSLNDALSQNTRWCVGLLEMAFCKYSPLTYGIRCMGILMAQCYAHCAFWAIWSIPITVYAFIPSLALLNEFPIFPKMYEPWFFTYMFMFLGAYGQDCSDFVLTKGTFERWWNDQRMWLVRGLSSYQFGFAEYVFKLLGVSTHGFNLTSKVTDSEINKRYSQGMFEFGVPSPMFVPLTTATILNLIAFFSGVFHVFREGNIDSFLMQILIAGFGVLNSFPLYKAMVLRTDKGKMALQTTVVSSLLAAVLYVIASIVFKI